MAAAFRRRHVVTQTCRRLSMTSRRQCRLALTHRARSNLGGRKPILPPPITNLLRLRRQVWCLERRQWLFTGRNEAAM